MVFKFHWAGRFTQMYTPVRFPEPTPEEYASHSTGQAGQADYFFNHEELEGVILVCWVAWVGWEGRIAQSASLPGKK